MAKIMQLYALDKNGELILARSAESKKNYSCLECSHPVRLRKGRMRQAHFYHANHEVKCSQRSKSLTHLALQEYLLCHLPAGEVELEKRFPLIKRIADVAWIKQKIIFEIQCSAIDEEEILARNRDYQSIGYETVWILHDKRYNKWRHTLAEKALADKPHYYTNFNQHGKGMVYDQFEIVQKGLRKVRFSPLPVNLAMPFSPGGDALLQTTRPRLGWKWRFQGDLLSSCIEDPEAPFLKKALLQEKKYFPKIDFFRKALDIFQFLKQLYLKWLMDRLERTVVQ